LDSSKQNRGQRKELSFSFIFQEPLFSQGFFVGTIFVACLAKHSFSLTQRESDAFLISAHSLDSSKQNRRQRKELSFSLLFQEPLFLQGLF